MKLKIENFGIFSKKNFPLQKSLYLQDPMNQEKQPS